MEQSIGPQDSACPQLAFLNMGTIPAESYPRTLSFPDLLQESMEECVVVFAHYRKDVGALERVQRRFTRTLPGLEG